MHLPSPSGLLFIAFIGVFLPWAVFKSRHRAREAEIGDRIAYFRKVIAQQFLFATFAGIVAWVDRIPIRVGELSLRNLALAFAVLSLLIVVIRPLWLKAVAENDPTPRRIGPRTTGERNWWLGVSLAAGVFEEFVWRGVLTAELWWMLDNWWLVAAISAVSFGVSHAIQGGRKMVIVATIAVVCQLLVYVTDGLLLAMVVHTIYDAVAGLTYGKELKSREKGVET